MIAYYIVRDVVNGANCSYKPGRTLLNEVYRFGDEAQRKARLYNDKCSVAGVCYHAMGHEETLPFPADHYENGGEVPDFTGASRYYVSVQVEDGEPFITTVVPQAVGVTIRSAVQNGMRSGTVKHVARVKDVRHEWVELRQLYCWSLA